MSLEDPVWPEDEYIKDRLKKGMEELGRALDTSDDARLFYYMNFNNGKIRPIVSTLPGWSPGYLKKGEVVVTDVGLDVETFKDKAESQRKRKLEGLSEL